MSELRWITAFVDHPAESFDRAVDFWSAVTGDRVSAPRGPAGEFVSLLPDTGDEYLKAQRVGEAEPRIHLDLHSADPRSSADRAVRLGATELADHGYVVVRSPGGLVVCFVAHPAATAPSVPVWPGGHSSRVYQVSIDAPEAAYDREAAFWAALVGGPAQRMTVRPEYATLPALPGAPLGLLLQRLDEPSGLVRAHLDVGTDDRPAEVARHELLGARVVADEEFWTVLADPGGSSYCITDRHPVTGLVAAHER